MKKKGVFLLALMLAAGLSITACSQQQSNDQQNAAPAQKADKRAFQQWDKPPAMQIDPNKTYIAHVDTNKGSFSIELFAKDAPKTVNNFVFLAREKFYDGIIFHRIVKDFVIQVGDPQAKGNVQNLKNNPQIGAGGPGYQFEDELSSKHKYEKGIVAMANSRPNTNGSQFFIGSGAGVETLNTQPYYTIFGKVIAGIDVVEAIANTPVEQGIHKEPTPSFPKENVFIKTITIEEK
ncbi:MULTISPECIES: peptidylprolyl isomerase [Aneurinibacillus]|uniref:Peptidyl-prolyl cis-trans isomerase n=1 Tax=Aneurinibacillus thermoaerophilus TaxID=143495 RepID=A0A1G7XKZ3_ANETH|nr:MULTISPECIES: peptidylprolyl isomerase [Aneurinibacillus]AMA73624.1 hypothetical protein ACH33_12655 [Aneurinibacillus sp. XH2]MED0675019.1 peptidylprolyl isomerase [Aneurinibacillus thermoaerophilus]MED0679579.1 peptidylprolyl isomerase [Aneurinibacillus thermoaerophilus]MED0737422.1 peptidylprolyl isomerase [Aneurinibacillus thermoaerophilus]MED0756271.1 peptidylprolyl isomerase [Aneurinibacillus thermoaerophilus]